jgi:hypothetical protein
MQDALCALWCALCAVGHAACRCRIGATGRASAANSRWPARLSKLGVQTSLLPEARSGRRVPMMAPERAWIARHLVAGAHHMGMAWEDSSPPQRQPRPFRARKAIPECQPTDRWRSCDALPDGHPAGPCGGGNSRQGSMGVFCSDFHIPPPLTITLRRLKLANSSRAPGFGSAGIRALPARSSDISRYCPAVTGLSGPPSLRWTANHPARSTASEVCRGLGSARAGGAPARSSTKPAAGMISSADSVLRMSRRAIASTVPGLLGAEDWFVAVSASCPRCETPR